MTNFSINFDTPLVLLLMIPALALTLIPYFRMNKRYRGTRNRITSMILHTIVMTLCVLIFAGFNITYDIPNTENEVILLVDTSYSGRENQAQMNSFVESVIDSTNSQFRVGVVTFGYGQSYAVELTHDVQGAYEQYLQALADNSYNSGLEASDIASALEFTATLFDHPESARIVLLSDGAETDHEATKVIRSIAAQGIKVDTVYFPQEEAEIEVQLLGVTTPNKSLRVGEAFALELTLQSKPGNDDQYVTVQLYDNDEQSAKQTIELNGDVQTIRLETSFAVPGMHKLSFEIYDAREEGVELGAEHDTTLMNNVLNSYMYLEVFEKVLIVERNDGESANVKEMLSETMEVTVVNIQDDTAMPKTVDDLRAYDEVIMCNIANADMPEGFADVLHSYVYDVGGGLFTIAGHAEGSGDGEWQANAYTREDMYKTTYQQMLPVEIINYTPPIAVMILIDRSGSMWAASSGEAYEKSKLYAAKQGAEACLDELSDRDYVGVIALSDGAVEEGKLTPRPQRAKILASIDAAAGEENKERLGGTQFWPALESARQALLANTKVEKRHIILVTDGAPGDGAELYQEQAKLNAEAGITMSVVGVQCDETSKRAMLELIEIAGGDSGDFYDVQDVMNVATTMREDLAAPEIKDVMYESFQPTISSVTNVVNNIRQEDMPMLDGFFGSKLREGATEILSAEYVPVYAQWQYGKGMVGSFMCDLNGTWSSDFVGSPTATTLINNIVNALFPSENIRPSDIQVELYEDNYYNTLSVMTPLEEGQKIQLTVTSPAADSADDPVVNVYRPDDGSGQTRISFQVTSPGQHELLIQKLNEDGTVASERTIYKCFSYTEEYDEFVTAESCEELLTKLANSGEGVIIEKDNPYAVFENVSQYLHKLIDPRIPFLIIALVLFLADIAARKFKWKWIHEIARDRKSQNAAQA